MSLGQRSDSFLGSGIGEDKLTFTGKVFVVGIREDDPRTQHGFEIFSILSCEKFVESFLFVRN